jgi:hypothetical protein
VEVEFDPEAPAGVAVTCAPEKIRGWEAAAVAGAESALRILRERGTISHRGRVTITDFLGLHTDTFDQEASAAALVAVVRAATGSVDSPDIEARDGGKRLTVVWLTPDGPSDELTEG